VAKQKQEMETAERYMGKIDSEIKEEKPKHRNGTAAYGKITMVSRFAEKKKLFSCGRLNTSGRAN
jgi:hypothetical protein